MVLATLTGVLPGTVPLVRAQAGWPVTAPPEVVLHWQPRTLEESARGPLSPRGASPTLARPGASPLAATDGLAAEWRELGPPVRAHHALVYDSRRHRFLQAGGNSFEGNSGSSGLDPQGSIWSFDLLERQWMEIARVPWPVGGARYVTDAVYDSLRDRLLVVTGSPDSLRVDALSLSGGGGWDEVWGERLTALRHLGLACGAALDVRRDALALRYAWGDSSGLVRIPLANVAGWDLLDLPAPTDMELGGGSLVYDVKRDRFYLWVGGVQPIGMLDAANPTSIAPLGFPESGHGAVRMVLDAGEDRLIGADNSGVAWAVPLAGGMPLRLDDRGLADRDDLVGPAYAFDPAVRRLYRSGGGRYSAASRTFESLTVDSGVVSAPEVPQPVAGAWLEERPLGMGSRLWPQTVFDPASGNLILVGGMPGPGTRPYASYAMVRSLDGAGGWEPLGAGSVDRPMPSYGPAVSLDPIHHAVLSFGGQAPNGTVTSDLWMLPLEDGGTWRRVEFAGPVPGARRFATLYCDQPRGRFILMGGDNASQYTSEAWELRLDPAPAWRPLAWTDQVRADYLALFSDPVGGGAWGFSQNRAFHLVLGADSIAADGGFEAFPAPGWSDPNYQLAGFDPVGGRFLFFSTYWGGIPRSVLDQAWWVSVRPGHEWSVVPIASPVPQNRGLMATTFDPDGRRLAMVGGHDDDLTYFADSWVLALPPSLPTPVTAALRFAESDAMGVRIAWLVTDGSGARALVERSADAVAWGDAGEARSSSADELRFDGPPLAAGERAAFRLVLSPGADETRTAPVWVSGPAAPALALAPRRNPAGPDLALSLALAPGVPARLRVLDAAGRVLADSRLPADTREWRYGGAAPPGLYFAELTQGTARRVAKLASVR